MLINVLRSKIQRALVTQSSVEYKGSITIDEDIMDRAGLHEYEAVHVNNSTNGNRDITYVLKGQRGSGIIGINGALSKRHKTNDIVHILSYCMIDEKEIQTHKPIIR